MQSHRVVLNLSADPELLCWALVSSLIVQTQAAGLPGCLICTFAQFPGCFSLSPLLHQLNWGGPGWPMLLA